MRLAENERSEVRSVSRIIPCSGGFNIPQLTAESVPKACFRVHTGDSFHEIVNKVGKINKHFFLHCGQYFH